MWERAFFQTETPKTKKTALRTSIVLGRKGDAFIPLKRLAQIGFGGKQGSGRQFVSWIHEKDFARAVEFVVDKEMEGAVNIVSPTPIRNAELMEALRVTLNVLFGIPLGEGMLKLGAKLIGTETELVLKSRNVIPKRLTEAGFKFLYPSPYKALGNLK